jgi:hypothetical protein
LRSLRYSALPRGCALLIDLCNTDVSAYLGVDIDAKPGQGQVTVLSVGESSRHLGKGGVGHGC